MAPDCQEITAGELENLGNEQAQLAVTQHHRSIGRADVNPLDDFAGCGQRLGENGPFVRYRRRDGIK